MNLPVWVTELARRFWVEAGTEEPFPRTLRAAITSTLPLSFIAWPALSVGGVLAWLRQRGIQPPVRTTDRRLRACLVAGSGHGFIFLDQDDPADEQRFSLAHELAHFLRDYWEPRRRLTEALGPAVLEVCDGRRAARPEEWLQALLRDLPLGVHVHLLHRDGGRPSSLQEEEAEEAADLLALELLAPSGGILVGTNLPPKMTLQCHLQERYALPAGAAARYADLLLPPPPPADPLLGRLPESLRNSCRTSVPPRE